MKKLLILFAVTFLSVNLSVGQTSNTYKPTLKKMLAVAGTEATFSTMTKQLFTMFKKQKSNVPEAVWNDFEKEFMQTSLDDLVDMLAPIYQKHFSEADLLKIIDFYQTPVGRKFAEKAPLIMQESMAAGQEWGRKIGERVTEKLKAKGYN